MLQGSGQDKGSLQFPPGRGWEELEVRGPSGCGPGQLAKTARGLPQSGSGLPRGGPGFPEKGHFGISAGLSQETTGLPGSTAGVAGNKNGSPSRL